MGYTHYWYTNREGDQRTYSDALIDIAEIVRHSPVSLGNAHGEGEGADFTDAWIAFNGRADATCPGASCDYCGGPGSRYYQKNHDLAHETCLFHCRLADLPRKDWATHDEPWVFDFTKTARKPYDVIVVAALCRLAECPGVRVASDGEASDWEAGAKLASLILGRAIAVPEAIVNPPVEA